ncbi:MAG: 2-oxoisovalerate dehydrogenase E1 subunit beta [Xenococcaceae cyanobacterium]
MSQLTEIVFLVENDPDGGSTAKALGESIFTEADDLESLKTMIKDALHCHFENSDRPKIIRLFKV